MYPKNDRFMGSRSASLEDKKDSEQIQLSNISKSLSQESSYGQQRLKIQDIFNQQINDRQKVLGESNKDLRFQKNPLYNEKEKLFQKWQYGMSDELRKQMNYYLQNYTENISMNQDEWITQSIFKEHEPFMQQQFDHFLEKFLRYDFTFLYSYQKKLCRWLQFVVCEHWYIFNYSYYDSICKFLGILKLKIQSKYLSNVIYRPILSLGRKISKMIGLQKIRDIEDVTSQLTDNLFQHFIKAMREKGVKGCSYFIQSEFYRKQLELSLLISHTNEFFESEVWQQFFFIIGQTIAQNQSKQEALVTLKKHRRINSMLYKIESENVIDLFNVSFFYEGCNFYNCRSRTLLSLGGNIKSLLALRDEESFLQQVVGMMNSEGGIFIFDYKQEYMKIFPVGQFLFEEQKVKITNRFKQLLSNIIPICSYGVDYVVDFVPVAFSPYSDQSWVDDQFRLKFKEGCFVTMLKLHRIKRLELYGLMIGSKLVKPFKLVQIISNRQKMEALKLHVQLDHDFRFEIYKKNGRKREIKVKRVRQQRQVQEKTWLSNMIRSCESSNQYKITQQKIIKQQMNRQKNGNIKEENRLSNNYQQIKKVVNKIKVYLSVIYPKEPEINIWQNGKQYLNKEPFKILNIRYFEILANKGCQQKFRQLYSQIKDAQSQFSSVQQRQQMQGLERKKSTKISAIQLRYIQVSNRIQKDLNFSIIMEKYLQQQSLRFQQKERFNKIKFQHLNLSQLLYFLFDRVQRYSFEIEQLKQNYFKEQLQFFVDYRQIISNSNNLASSIELKCKQMESLCAQIIKLQKVEKQRQDHEIIKKINIFTFIVAQCQKIWRQSLKQSEMIGLIFFMQALFDKFMACLVQKIKDIVSDDNKKVIFEAVNQMHEASKKINVLNQQQRKKQYFLSVQPHSKIRQLNLIWPQYCNISSQQIKLDQSKISSLPQKSLPNDLKTVQLDYLSTLVKLMSQISQLFNQVYPLISFIAQKQFLLKRQFSSLVQLFESQIDLIEEYYIEIVRIYQNIFLFSNYSQYRNPPLIGKVLLHKKMGDQSVLDPQKRFKYASALISQKIHIPKIKERLGKYNMEYQIVPVEDKYGFRGSSSSSVLYHNCLYAELSQKINYGAEFIFQGKHIKVAPITDFIVLVERKNRNIMTKQDFEAFQKWLSVEFKSQKLKMWKFMSDKGQISFYLTTESRASTLFMFLLLNHLGQKSILKNPDKITNKLDVPSNIFVYYPPRQ